MITPTNAFRFVACIILIFVCGCSVLPKDRVARSFFLKNEPVFQKIVEMLERDGLLSNTTISSQKIKGPTFTQDVCIFDLKQTNTVNWAFEKKQIEDYQRVFTNLKNISAVFIYTNTARVYFVMASSGLVISGGSDKGIAYVPRPADYPSNAIVSSLDEIESKDLEGNYLVPIKDKWCIYYSYTK